MSNTVKTPQIDVIIPVYNGERFIIDALQSVVSQTLPPSSIIVVDDGSTDSTHTLVSEYATTSPVTITIMQKENGGLSSARNAGIKKSTAPYLAFLDADDIWEKNKLEAQCDVYENSDFKNLGLVYCLYNLINEDGSKNTTDYIPPLNKKLTGNAFNALLPENLILGSGSGVMVPKTVFNTVGFFDEQLIFSEDWDMWLRIAQQFEISYVPQILVHLRKHPTSMTKDATRGIQGEIVFLNKWVEIIKNTYPIPRSWPDRLISRALKRLPKTDFFSFIKKELVSDTYTLLFKKTRGSLFLYSLYFLIRRAWKKVTF